MKPYIVREVDDLRKTVSVLQAQVQEQKLDNELLKSSVTGLQKATFALEDRTTALEGRADSEEQQEDPEEKKPKSPGDADDSRPKATPSVATIRSAFAGGGWVILHGQCWRLGDEGEKKYVMVSDEEMAENGISWKSIRGMSDQELLQVHDIVRGGSKITVEGRLKGTLVSESEVRKANHEFLAELAAQEGDTEGDEVTTEESTADSEVSDDNAKSQDEAALDGSSDKEPDLRRRSRRPERRLDKATESVDAVTWDCNKGHAFVRYKSIKPKRPPRRCDACDGVVKVGDLFQRCRFCARVLCLECHARP